MFCCGFCDVLLWFLRCFAVAWQPVCRTGLWFRHASKTNIKDEQKTVLKLVLKRGTRRWREFSFWVVDSLRFENSPERRRTTQRQPSQKCLVAATHCEFSSGVNHWRTRFRSCMFDGTPAAYPHSLRSFRYSSADFLWELRARNLTATIGGTAFSGKSKLVGFSETRRAKLVTTGKVKR